MVITAFVGSLARKSVAFSVCPIARLHHPRNTLCMMSSSNGDAPYQPLEQLLQFRGTVDSGYGRGGKKLGFPTANLPESLFYNALGNVSTGVYFGWAVVEGRNGEIHKAAVNVGYSPTFEGKENTEKIIEAHLIPDEPLEDFYGETMRLALCGFLRPEQKFDSFPDLMAAIANDVSNAKEALDVERYASFKTDLFLVNANEEWIGTSGGDATASWEFQDLSAAIDRS
jgi:riboflavin kinase